MEKRSTHILELAQELLDDIELSRFTAESLLLKATRLARFEGSDEIKEWLSYELKGYNPSNEISLKYMTKTKRWVNEAENKGYWMPLAEVESYIESEKIKLSAMRTPDISTEFASEAIRTANIAMSNTSINISKFSGIKSRVLALLHDYISDVYYKKLFDNLAESIFEKYKTEIDLRIISECEDVLEKIPSVIDRLSDGGEEGVSQALHTCRRIINSFANSIFPPTEETITIDGKTLSLKEDKVQNRINAFIHKHSTSKSLKKKLRQNLGNLYDRVSTGVHKDVTANEAKSLFLNTYLLIGEILLLEKNNK